MTKEDVLFDAKKIIKKISPAAWGQLFADGSRGFAISLNRVLDCLQAAKVEPSANEGYVQRDFDLVFKKFFNLVGFSNDDVEKAWAAMKAMKAFTKIKNIYDGWCDANNAKPIGVRMPPADNLQFIADVGYEIEGVDEDEG